MASRYCIYDVIPLDNPSNHLAVDIADRLDMNIGNSISIHTITILSSFHLLVYFDSDY